MLKKTTRLSLEIFMAVITALLLVLAVFLWRLSQGPMEVPSLNSHLQSSLSGFSEDVDITIQQTILAWGGFEHPLAIHLHGVRALNQLGGEIAAVNEVSLDLSLPDLLIGRFIPTHINIMKPSIAITRGAGGRFDINVHSKKKSEGEKKQNLGHDPIKEILEVISDPKRQGIARKLESFTISNSEIFYQDIPSGFTLISPTSDIQLIRDDQGIEGVVTLNVEIAGKSEALRGQVDYNFENEETTVSLAINQFNPSAVSSLSPDFKNAKNFDIPLNGILHIRLNNLFQILSFNLIGTAESGRVFVPQVYEEALMVDGARLDIGYNPNDGSIFMKQLAFDIDGFQIDVQGRLTQSFEDSLLTLEATAGLFNIKADQLAIYWPKMLAPGAQRWVTTNISDGIVPRATADLKLIAPLTDITLINTEKLEGKIFVEGATVDYLKPMLPVKDVNAVASFTKDTFSVDIHSGALRDTVIQSGKVDIIKLDQPVPEIAINLTAEGALQDGLFLVGSKPLELTKEMGIDYTQFEGQAVTNLFLEFPLLKDLLKSQVKIKASSTMTQVSGRGIVDDLNVSSEKLQLEADNDQMTIEGQARLADIPITLNWVERFGDEAPFVRQMTASGQVNAADVSLLSGVDLSSYIISPFQATASIQETQTGDQSTAITMDLKNTSVVIPVLNYTKSAGQDAMARFDIVEEEGGITALKNVDVSAPDLAVQGDLSFVNSALQSLNFSTFKNNGTDAQITALKENDRYKVTVKGKSLDAVEAWNNLRKQNSAENNDAEKSKYPAVAISANVDQLKLSKDQNFNNVKAAIELKPDRIHRMEMDAISGTGDIYLRYTPFESGTGYQLRFETPDAGAALKAFGLTDKIAGGTMIVDAASAVNEPDLIVGGLTMKNYKVVKAPVLGRLLNALSPTGLAELLNSEGINFLELESKWYYKNDLLTFQTGRMAGSSLGLNYEGPVNLATNYMDIKGTIVPVDPVNRVIGTLPVVGQILGGTKGEGLFAATYEIKGDIEEPKVTVNPLAALAPGILRSIFFEGGL